MHPSLLADLIVVLHLVYVLYVILGFALIWLGVWLRWDWVRRPLFRLPHLVFTVVVPLEALVGFECPLTTWERALRVQAGETTESISFIGRLTRDLLFYEAKPWVFTVCYVTFGLLVVGTFFLVPIRRREAGPGAGAP